MKPAVTALGWAEWVVFDWVGAGSIRSSCCGGSALSTRTDAAVVFVVGSTAFAVWDILWGSIPMIMISCNIVQLERGGGDEWWSVGLRPEGVVGAFDVPFDVFAFDDAGVGPAPSGWVEAVGEPADCLEPEPVSRLRGENRPAGRSRHV